MSTFQVLVSRLGAVEYALGLLAKRAIRRHLSPLTWILGTPYPSKEGARVPLTLSDARTVEGWTFVASLTHLDGENVIKAIDGSEVPTVYRTRGPACDYCKTDRRRDDTFVLRHVDGRTMQVGSTCLRASLGSDDAARAADEGTLLAEARAIAEGGYEGTGGAASHVRLEEFLAYVAHAMGEVGWIARSAGNGKPTADVAWTYATDGAARREDGVTLSSEHEATGVAAALWAEGLTDEQVNASTSDYLHNLRTIARHGLVTWKTAGLAGSIVVAYEREIGRVRLAKERAERPTVNEYLGNEGAKVAFACTHGKGKSASTVLSAEPLTLDFVTGYNTDYGYTTVLKFRTVEGHTIVWKASNTNIERSDVGKKYSLRGTIKKHDDYKGAKQTLLTRCTVTEIEET